MGIGDECLDRVDGEVRGEDQEDDADGQLGQVLDPRRPVRMLALYAEAPDEHDRGGGIEHRVKAKAEQRQCAAGKRRDDSNRAHDAAEHDADERQQHGPTEEVFAIFGRGSHR